MIEFERLQQKSVCYAKDLVQLQFNLQIVANYHVTSIGMIMLLLFRFYGDYEMTSKTYFWTFLIHWHWWKPLNKRCNVTINFLSCDKNDVQHKNYIRLKLLSHGNKHQPIYQYLSWYKLTPQDSRNYHERKMIDNAKKTCVCIVAEKITKFEIVLLKLQPWNYTRLKMFQ
jgi:hypothetical protein